jgi:DNA (cytosine-5)-methyltransferase 1
MASEVDKFANISYELLYGHKTVGDVTKVIADAVPDHVLGVAGFPCPTFSVAGGRDGMEYRCQDCGHEHLITFTDYKEGTKCPKCSGHTEPKDVRGMLFFEIARLAEVKQPKALILENVKGLISSAKGEVMRVITETLNLIGYTVDFDVLNSKYFGVPQNRERVFVIAMRDDLIEPEEWTIEGTNVVAKGKRRISQLDGVKTFNFDWPEQTEVTERLRDVLEPVVDERYYLSEEKTAKLVAQLEAKGEPQHNRDIKMVGHADIDGHDFNKRIYSVDGVSRTLNTASDIGRSVKVAEPSDIKAEKIAGLYGARQAGSMWDVNKISPTLKTSSGGYSEPLIEDKINSPRYRIRKLTPLECFRLQGFPDEAYEVLSANGISNSQLYKQAGNAVTVNVIDAIGRRLLPMITESEAE